MFLFLLLCLLSGLGICMTETPAQLLVNEYFVEKRLTANGFRAAGNPMGGMLFPPLLVLLNEHFGVQGTLIIMAGVMLHLAILGMLMRPFEEHKRIIHRQHIRAAQLKLGTTTSTYGSMSVHTHTDKHPSKKKALDFTIFKNPQYLIYVGVAVFINLGLPNFLIYLPSYSISVGLTEYQTSIVNSYVSGIDFVFRMLCGYVTDKLNLNGAHVFAAG